MPSSASRQLISFGPFEFDAASGLLYRGERETLLPPRVARILEVLLDRSGEVLTKDTLLSEVWRDAFVGEDSLTQAISMLRGALGDDPRNPTYIQTIPKRGYRFIAKVQINPAAQVEPPLGEGVATSGEGAARSTEAASRPPPAPRTTPPLIAVGSSLGRYEILDEIGAGAMGVVYRARDVELEREVAIKVLPEDFISDPERVARFEREAKLLAAVSHPNIAAIYSLEEAAGTKFPVMELVEGETLEERLRLGPLGVEACVEIARQTASAVEAAHDRGIVHRDLKPANIKITPDGQVKVLDFGLAKALEVHVFGDGVRGEKASASPTESMTIVGSHRGSIVGTAAYMSPEQARGLQAGKQADIWALGCVLYEMLTGKRAFAGDTVSDTIAKLLERAPDWKALPAETPRAMRRLLRRCLAKDPRDRLHDIADARIELAETSRERAADEGTGAGGARAQDTEEVEVGKSTTPVNLRNAAALAAVILIAGIALGWLAAIWIRGPGLEPNTETGRVLPTSNSITSLDGYEQYPAVSPDGRNVAFIWKDSSGFNHLYVRSLSGVGQPKQLTFDDRDDWDPAWSPDGDRIAFTRWSRGDPEAEVLWIPALGGEPTPLTIVPDACYRSGLDWSPSGEYLALPSCDGADDSTGIFLMSTEDGRKHQITFPPTEGPRVYDDTPVFSPDGTKLAFVRKLASSGSAGYVWVQSLGGGRPLGQPEQLTFSGFLIWDLDWTAEGDAVVHSEGASEANSYLMIVPVPAGEARRLVAGERARHVSIAQEGNRLVYSRWQDDRNIWRIGGPAAPEAGPPLKMYSSTWDEHMPAYSPQGDRVAFESDRLGSRQLWIGDSDGGQVRRLSELGWVLGPAWDPDGGRIAFSAVAPGASQMDVYVIDASGGFERKLTADGFDNGLPFWSDDGVWIYFNRRGSGTAYEIWRTRSDGSGSPTRITEGPTMGVQLYDGRIYFFRRGRIWSAGAEGGDERMVVDTPVVLHSWRIWGDALVYIRTTGTPVAFLEIFDLRTHDTRVHATLELDASAVGQAYRFWGLTVSPDGQFILFSRLDVAGSDLVVVENYR